MKQYKGRLSEEDYELFSKFVMALGFVEGKGTDRERPLNGAFFRSLIDAKVIGNVAIATNGKTATITIKLPQ